MKKKVLSLLLVAAMGVSMLVGCGGGNQQAGGNNTQKPSTENAGTEKPAEVQKVTLKVWAPENQQEVLQKQAAAFNEAYKDKWEVTFEFGMVGDDKAKDEVLKDVEAAADVFFFANDQIKELVAAGAIAKLGGDAEALVKGKMAESVYTTVTVDGSIYAIPYTHNTFFMYYDKTIMTEEDLKSLDTIIAKETADGVYNFLFDGGGGWKLGAWYYAAGLSVYGMDGTDLKAGCNWNNETGVAVTNYIIDMHANKKVAVGMDVTELISNHKLGAWFGGDWELKAFTDALGDDLGYTVIPTYGLDGKQVQMKSFYGSKAVGVNAKSKNPAVAVAFATFINTGDQQALRFEISKVIPTNSDAANTDAVKSNALANVIMKEANECAIMQPYSKEFSSEYWTPCTALCDDIKAKVITKENVKAKLDEWVKTFDKYK